MAGLSFEVIHKIFRLWKKGRESDILEHMNCRREKQRTKIWAYLLLAVWAVLLHVSVITAAGEGVNVGKVSCFGIQCGPVEHVVTHNYITEDSTSGDSVDVLWTGIPEDFIFAFQSPEIDIETPPPQTFLA